MRFTQSNRSRARRWLLIASCGATMPAWSSCFVQSELKNLATGFAQGFYDAFIPNFEAAVVAPLTGATGTDPLGKDPKVGPNGAFGDASAYVNSAVYQPLRAAVTNAVDNAIADGVGNTNNPGEYTNSRYSGNGGGG